MQLSEALDVYFSVRAQEGFSPATIKLYRSNTNILINDIGDIDIASVTLDMLRHHLSQRPHVKLSTVACRVRSLKSIFKWLYEEEYVPKNPTLKLREPKQPKRVPKALTVDEIESLRDSCQSRFEHALVEFFFATGCRVGEVVALNRTDIDWNRCAVTVFGKGGRERECYFGAKARIWLRRYLASRKDDDPALFVSEHWHKRPTTRYIEKVFKVVASRCGLEQRVTPHVLRHTLATTLLNQGAPLATVQSILGHQKPDTTLLYVSLSGTARKQSYDRYFVQ